jgi:hypothetical protein
MNQSTQTLVIETRVTGLTIIPAQTPLTRLNYFDGKFLRADDLKAEQSYDRQMVALSNQPFGTGVAYGFDLSLGAGDTLRVGGGLAIDPAGGLLRLPADAAVSIQLLIDRSRQTQAATAATNGNGNGAFGNCVQTAATPPDNVADPGGLFLITIAQAEALCGEEDVLGNPCEEACVTSSGRPFVVEGVVLRALPLLLTVPLVTSAAVALTQTHFRSRVASAYFAMERGRIGSLISRDGLSSAAWCAGALAACGRDVPLGVLGRAGTSTIFLDAWTARRERLDAQAHRYWQYRMRMRALDIFLAQVLQFQCQLRDGLQTQPQNGGGPCDEAQRLIGEAAPALDEVTRFLSAVSDKLLTLTPGSVPTITGGLARLSDLQKRFFAVNAASVLGARERVLINSGIVELPPAGFLPVVPGDTPVNTQVRQLLGEGLDLRFCAVQPPEFVGHAFEEAQHLPRISLLAGLDDPQNKPPVDVLVPNGQIVQQDLQPAGRGFEALVNLVPTSGTVGAAGAAGSAGAAGAVGAAAASAVSLRGAARTEILPAGGGALHFAGAASPPPVATVNTLASAVRNMGTAIDHLAILTDIARTPAPTSESAPFIDPLTAAQLHAAAALASRFTAASSSGTGIFASGNAAGAGTFAVAQSPPVSLWTTMRSDRNAFALSPGDITPVELRVTLASPSQESPVVIDVTLRGTLEIQQSFSSSALQRRFAGRLRGVFSRHVVSGNQTTDSTGTFDNTVKVVFTLALAGQENQLDVLFTNAAGAQTFHIRAGWAPASPLRVHASIDDTVGQQIATLAIADLTENQDVLLANNAANQFARAALAVLGAALADGNFAETSGRLLFPQPPPIAQETIVKPTLDWVLFNHRRTKQCGQAEERPPAAPPRTYEVYHLLFIDTIGVTLAQIRDALRTGDTSILIKMGFREVDLVEFAPLAAGLDTDPDLVRQDWKNALPGARLMYGAIASQGSAVNEGSTLANARLATLQQTLAPVTPLDPQGLLETLPAVPATLPSGPDGIIVLITQQAENIPFQFASSATPANIVASRLQKVADVVLDGKGGAAGQAISVDVTIFMNAPIDNPATALPPELVIDDPPPDQEKLGVNKFQAKLSLAGQTNTAVFTGVPLVFPGAQATRRFRIRNVDVDASGLAGGTGPGGQAFMVVSLQPSEPIDNPQLLVGVVTGLG